MEPATLDAVRDAASKAGISVNAWLCEAVAAKLGGEGLPSSVARSDALRALAKAAEALADGFVLVPGAEAPGSAWDSLMGGS
jgi:hypothetical protein